MKPTFLLFRIISVYLFLFLSVQSQSQSLSQLSKEDLLVIAEENENDSVRVEAYIELISRIAADTSEFKNVQAYLHSAFKPIDTWEYELPNLINLFRAPEADKWKILKINELNYWGGIATYANSDDFLTALNWWTHETYPVVDSAILAKCELNFGIAMREIGMPYANFQSGHFYRARIISEQINNLPLLLQTHTEVAKSVLFSNRPHAEVEDAINKANDLADKLDVDSVKSLMNTIRIELYFDQENMDSVEFYYTNALLYAEGRKDSIRAYLSMARGLFNKKDYKRASDFLKMVDAGVGRFPMLSIDFDLLKISLLQANGKVDSSAIIGNAAYYKARKIYHTSIEQDSILGLLVNIYSITNQKDSLEKFQGIYERTKLQNKYQRKIGSIAQTVHYQTRNSDDVLWNNLELLKNIRAAQIRIIILVLIIVLIVFFGAYFRIRYVRRAKAIIEKEKNRSEKLLLNILPAEVAEELKEKGEADAKGFDLVSILFTDFKGFTERSSNLDPSELIAELNTCFKAFDAIIEKYGIEKIKTIGDAYMAAGGIPIPNPEGVKSTILAALDMQNFIEKRKQEREANGNFAFQMRAGIHTGPVVAGIVGVKKFQYDIWGDTVNTASRMESNGEVSKVNISNDTYELIKHDSEFTFESRDKIEVKGKGEMQMWFVSLA